MNLAILVSIALLNVANATTIVVDSGYDPTEILRQLLMIGAASTMIFGAIGMVFIKHRRSSVEERALVEIVAKSVASPTKQCGFCGRRVPIEAKWCPYCGHYLGETLEVLNRD